ncbi:MAG: MerR family transcriptional regulator [Bacteroidota bacterium]
MIDTTKLTKLYYAIGEVAAMFEVNASLIRFWEKEFGLIQPKKNKKGNRLFTPKDIATFSKIYDLVKVKGFTLDGAKKALKSKNPVELSIENVSNEIIISRLEAIKSKLIKLKD